MFYYIYSSDPYRDTPIVRKQFHTRLQGIWYLKWLRHQHMIEIEESPNYEDVRELAQGIPVQYVAGINLCIYPEPIDDTYGHFDDGYTTYYLIKSDMTWEQLQNDLTPEYVKERERYKSPMTFGEVRSMNGLSYVPQEGYEDEWSPPNKAARLRRLDEISDVKFLRIEKKFVCIGPTEVKNIKKEARRAVRRQNKKMIRDYLP